VFTGGAYFESGTETFVGTIIDSSYGQRLRPYSSVSSLANIRNDPRFVALRCGDQEVPSPSQ
jgi:hypothetical protein